jgi:hypothetical protein
MALNYGQIGVISKAITFADAGTGVELGFLPANAYITAIQVGVSTAFNGDTTNTLDVGITGTLAKFANDISLAAVANASVTLLGSGVVQSTSTATKLIGTVVSTATPSAGVARVNITYVQL